MDLDEFDTTAQSIPETLLPRINSPSKALAFIDRHWFIQATRSARWMDLLGDYAGRELFVIDGEAIFQIVLDDPLLAIGRGTESTFQILHAYMSLEKILNEFTRRSANFEIVFWSDTRHLTSKQGGAAFNVASRILARSMLFAHLLKLHIPVLVFEGCRDPLWISYVVARKPMFVMTNDGGVQNQGSSSCEVEGMFIQRSFLLSLLSGGTAAALLKGAEYRDSKIISFVYEPMRNPSGNGLLVVSEKLHNQYVLGLEATSPILRISNRSVEPAGQIDILHKVDILESIETGVPPEIIYLFIVHCLILPNLSVQERAQTLPSLSQELVQLLTRNFFPTLFLKLANLLSSLDYVFELDGTIFSKLIATYYSADKFEISTFFGPMVHVAAQSVWLSLGAPPLDFPGFAARYPLPQEPQISPDSPHQKMEPYNLLPFNNIVFDEKMTAVRIPSTEGTEANLQMSPLQFEKGTIFADTQHWHNQRTILPSHLGGSKPKPTDERAKRRQLRSDQKFMAILQVQAATLTGASGGILQQVVIPPVSSRAKVRVPQKVKANSSKLSSKERLLRDIKDEKDAKSRGPLSIWWKNNLMKMSKMPLAQQLGLMKDLYRSPKMGDPLMALEMRLFRLHLELMTWLQEDVRDSSPMKDKYTVSVMRMVKDICDKKVLTPSATKALTSVLVALGFGDYVPGLLTISDEVKDQCLQFDFIKLMNSKTKVPYYQFMAIDEPPVVWQLRLFGEYMDRSMDSSPDCRVTFEPDAWQRRVLDCIDQNHSLLVVAPTSAGKTFISYYAMEKLLRESDDGILVYIAPTKALVTQVAAEVYARFSKDLNGRSCWAIHTRDFRIHDPQKCQILVTVPEMLGIMLLSPTLARVWTSRIKRIILDEIHSLGQQAGGAIWEQIILLAPCPIIGLSATVGAPEVFNEWLSSIQKAHKFDHTFIEHPHRYSHLRKFFYIIKGEGTFTGLDRHRETNRARFLHPIGLLSLGVRPLPPDLSLEAQDTLTLFRALHSLRSVIDHNLDSLEPKTFFSSTSKLLRQKDVLRYETALKLILSDLIQSYNSNDALSPLDRVARNLQDPLLLELELNPSRPSPSRSDYKHDLIQMLADLHVQGKLPAVLFSLDRTDCEIMAQHLVETLEVSEEQWRVSSPEWTRKVAKWETWKLQAKERERATERAKKQSKRRDDAEDSHRTDTSWESSFDPEEPSPQFSFIGSHSSHSTLSLEEDIAKLKWTSVPRWTFAALRRGIAVHHAGMHKHYRTLIESLFRKGFVRVMISTGTLALGINAPAKTSVFCGDSPFLTALMYRQCAGRAGRRGFDSLGNVVFYGLPLDRVQRLVFSKLPFLSGNFPLTSTLTLRLFNLLEGSTYSDYAVQATQSLMALPSVSFGSDIGRHQLLHHLRFSIEYLRRSRLLDEVGKPMNLFAIAAHLYYTEPSNLALVALMRSGVLHTICSQSDLEVAQKKFMLMMCNLFGRRYLSSAFAQKGHIEALTAKYPSMVVLPPMPSAAQKVLFEHDCEILRIFTGYAFAFAMQSKAQLGTDDTLPLSKIRYQGTDLDVSCPFRTLCKETAIQVVVRSAFVANSGHDDSFSSIFELTQTSRQGLNLNGHAIPSMSHLLAAKNKGDDTSHMLNAHILDFYVHGQVSTLANANGIRRGDVWYLLQDFNITLLTVKAALQQLMLKASKDALAEKNSKESDLDDYQNHDLAEGESFEHNSEEEDDASSDQPDFKRPAMVTDADWRVYKVVDGTCAVFNGKFRAMWA
ncbi:hypothetical protein B0H34DRAFT_506081 [Crassisporium funariophilum]|nr:hypothetical protein B0H34DRAFT_506081 [Crassisporium funariophilum]